MISNGWRVITNGLKPKVGDLIQTSWGGVGKVLSVNTDGSLVAKDAKGSQASVKIADVAKILPANNAIPKGFISEVS